MRNILQGNGIGYATSDWRLYSVQLSALTELIHAEILWDVLMLISVRMVSRVSSTVISIKAPTAVH